MYLRISLTDRCNLRCRYCLPAHPRFAPARATSGELMRLTELVVAEAGVYKIRLTGGEPTLRPELLAHVRHAAALVPTVGMTSNGVLLESRLAALQAAGLRRLNISLDSVDPAAFRRTTRRGGLERVLASIARAKQLGFEPLKINAVARRETDFAGLLAFACRERLHLRFIEHMAIGSAIAAHRTAYIDAAGIRQRLWEAGYSLCEARERDEPTSRVWTLPDLDPAETSVGFITTGSDPFCATCDRLRLSSQGRLHTCLFDERGHELLEPLRAGDEPALRARIRHALASKRPPARFLRHQPMAAIGG